MRAEEKINPTTRVDTTKRLVDQTEEKSASCAEWTVKENFPATSDPPP